MQIRAGGVNGNEMAAALGSRRKFLPAKLINRFAMVFLTGLCKRLGPFGMVDGIGVKLSFQSNAGALAVIDAALTVFVQEIARVELNAGTIGMYRHGTSGAGIPQNGTGGAEYLKIVIIAALQFQTFIIRFNIAADGLGFPEVKGCGHDWAQFAGGNIGSIVGIKEAAGDSQLLMDRCIHILVSGSFPTQEGISVLITVI